MSLGSSIAFLDGRFVRRCGRVDGVLAGVPGDQRRPGVRRRRGGRHGRRAGGPPARHAPHPPAAAAAARHQPQHRHRRRRAPPARVSRRHAPRHPPRRGTRRALPRHERPTRLRRRTERDGVPSVRDPLPFTGFIIREQLRHGSPLLHERGTRRRRHRRAPNAHPIPRRARQDQATAGSRRPQAHVPASGRRRRANGHGPAHPENGGPPRRVPRADGDRAPRRAGARRLLLDLRVRQGAAAPGLPRRRRRRRGNRHHARRRRARRRRQLGLLLPARRRQVAAPGADGVPGCTVPWRGGLFSEERRGGRVPRAVAGIGHRRCSGVRCQWRHLLGVRAGAKVLGQWERPEAGHGGKLMPIASICDIGSNLLQRHHLCNGDVHVHSLGSIHWGVVSRGVPP